MQKAKMKSGCAQTEESDEQREKRLLEERLTQLRVLIPSGFKDYNGFKEYTARMNGKSLMMQEFEGSLRRCPMRFS
jgi:hypothetical protein